MHFVFKKLLSGQNARFLAKVPTCRMNLFYYNSSKFQVVSVKYAGVSLTYRLTMGKLFVLTALAVRTIKNHIS